MASRPRVALTGATGFIGSRIATGLVDGGASVTALTRDVARTFPPGVAPIDADLESARGLSDALAECGTLVHAASYVGSDEGLQHRVNVLGTERLLSAARDAGVARILYLSTASVYGGTLSAGTDETRLRPSPRSALSRSRREAEIRVVAAGGTIIRPHMVVGAGDRWFLRPLLKLLIGLERWIEDGTARVSVINVAALGRAVAHLALVPHVVGVYNAAEVEPVTVRRLVEPVLTAAGLGTPTRSISLDEARRLLVPHVVSENQLDIVARDNVLDARRLWDVVPNGRPTHPLLPCDVAWYSDML